MTDREAAAGSGRTFGVVAKLFGGFGFGVALVALLLGMGDRVMERASQRMQQTLTENVRPLVQLHHLQARLDGLRQLEIELSRIRDYFPVVAHIDRMRAEMLGVEQELGLLAARDAAGGRLDELRARDHWRIYRSQLERQIELAGRMEMAAAERISATESYLSYSSIEKGLGEAAHRNEAAAEDAYRQLVAEQNEQRLVFKVLTLGGSVLLLGLLLFIGHSLARRISDLREGALRMAAGEATATVVVAGNDEITDLAVAFRSMQDKVAARERALVAARQELEQRVEARTSDLRDANRRLTLFLQAVEQSPVGILIASIDGRIQFVNDAYARITGHIASAVVGGHLSALFDESDSSGLAGAIEHSLRSGHEWEAERNSRRPDGVEYWERLRLVAVLDDHGSPAHLLLSREDITERRSQEEKIAYQAHYDSLTGLPNRVLALDRLVQMTGRSRRDGGKAVAMFIDLDNFKQINDTLGHAAGDALLRQAAARLKLAVRGEDTVARLGGDEFLVIMSGLARSNDASAVAEKIIESFASPFVVDGRELFASTSIGLAVYPDDGIEPTILLRNADLAMYEAKEAGRNTYRFFNQAIHDISLERLETGRCLRGALERNELHLVFMPLVDSQTGRVVGAESLLRWKSPELGDVLPERFIPIAEQNGLIVDIGRWVLREACACLARWRNCDPSFVIAVNVSPRQFRAAGFVDTVRNCLEEFSVPTRQLEIEVTEGVLLRNQEEVGKLLAVLDGMGVALSMDDFGTGYSSLSYLRDFPFHTIKIDRSFIRDVSDDTGDRALVVAAVRMAKALGMRIIAEGVESDEQWSFLAEHDCDVLQGYRFGEPLDASTFEHRWLNSSVERATGTGT